jgi:glycosyltransferase involved in cell wall biosynthesis
MNVLVFNYEFPPLGGGAGIVTSSLLLPFANDESVSMDVITSSTGTQRIEHFAKNIRVHFLDIKKGSSLHQQKYSEIIRYTWKSFWYARRLKKQNAYSLCHIHCGIPSAFAALFLGLPYVITLHGSDVPFNNKRHLLLDIFVSWWLQRLICRRAFAVVAVSEYLADLARRVGLAKNIRVILNGVDVHRFTPAREQDAQKRRVVICVGRLVEQKNPVKALLAFRSISEQFSDVDLHFVGGGPLFQKLQNLVQNYGLTNRVLLHGSVPQDRLPLLLQAATVFLITSFNEGFSLATLEAMACGLPVVCTKRASYLVNESNGIVVTEDSVEAVSVALRKMLENPDMMDAMGKTSREIAQQYSWDQASRQYKLLFEEVIMKK